MATRRRRGPANNSGGSGNNNNNSSSSRKQQKVLPPGRDFWGRDFEDEDLPEVIRSLGEPATMVRSLGAPPLPGQDRAAEHYFVAIYDKAANLAGALAATAGMLDFDEHDEN